MPESYTISFDLQNDIILWKYPADSFAATSSILIRNNQKAMIVHNGIVCDVLDMGVILPGADIMPGIWAKCSLPSDFGGMIEAEIWFVSMEPMSLQAWQVDRSDHLHISDISHSPIDFVASGSIRLTISDPSMLFKNTEPSASSYTAAKFLELVRKDFMAVLPVILSKKVQQDQINVSNLSAPYDALSGFCMHYFNENRMPQSGYKLSSFVIDSLVSFAPPIIREPDVIHKPKPSPSSSSRPYYLFPIGIAIICVVFGLLYYATSISSNSRNKAVMDVNKKLYEEHKIWSYSQTKNEDSVVIQKFASLYSDQSLEELKNDNDLHAYLDVSLNLSKFIHPYSTDTSIYLALNDGYQVRPFAMKRSRTVMLRFDSDTSMSVRLESYFDGDKILTFPPADLLIPRLRTSHKLSIMLTPTSNPDSVLEFTFHTAGLKW